MPKLTPLSLSDTFAPSGERALADDLYEYLQAAIRQGDLVSGQRLVEDAIAEATAVSRTPVREALRKLVSSGLAVRSGRGIVVARLSAYELQELYEVLEVLYVASVRLAAENRSEVDVAEMRHVLDIETKRGASGAESAGVNRQFRQCILRAAGNGYLADLLETIVSQAEALVDFTPARTRPEAVAEHSAILDSIDSRDPDAAQSAMQHHIRANLTALLIKRHTREAATDGRPSNEFLPIAGS